MDNLVERVARAIWETPLRDQPPGYEVRQWPPNFTSVEHELADQARAIIPLVMEWLQEPTREMIEAATDLWWLDFNGDEETKVRVSENVAREVWRDMLNARSSEIAGLSKESE